MYSIKQKNVTLLTYPNEKWSPILDEYIISITIFL
jgi:hypothetical protein